MKSGLSLGLNIEQIAHDLKNHLGIIKTLLLDLKSGYKIDTASIEDSLLVIEKINNLGNSLSYSSSSIKKASNDEITLENSLLEIIRSILNFEKEENDIEKININIILSNENFLDDKDFKKVNLESNFVEISAPKNPKDILTRYLLKPQTQKNPAIKILSFYFHNLLNLNNKKLCRIIINEKEKIDACFETSPKFIDIVSESF